MIGESGGDIGRARTSPYPERARTPVQMTSPSTAVSPYLEQSRTRVSPYPERVRTPTQVTPAPAPLAREHARPPQTETTPATQPHRLQLIVQPIVKSTVGQRDTSGVMLDDFAANGSTFQDILRKLWDKFSGHVSGRAVKQDGVWSIETPTMATWSKVMQFKSKRHLVESAKTEHSWNLWLSATRGETVKLLIYDYGLAITKAHDREAFVAACIRPEQTDRAGATAECSLRNVVERLQEHWGGQVSMQKQWCGCGACGQTTSRGISIDQLGVMQF